MSLPDLDLALEGIQKARRLNKEKLVPKKITDKKGNKRTVWVRPGEVPKEGKKGKAGGQEQEKIATRAANLSQASLSSSDPGTHGSAAKLHDAAADRFRTLRVAASKAGKTAQAAKYKKLTAAHEKLRNLHQKAAGGEDSTAKIKTGLDKLRGLGVQHNLPKDKYRELGSTGKKPVPPGDNPKVGKKPSGEDSGKTSAAIPSKKKDPGASDKATTFDKRIQAVEKEIEKSPDNAPAMLQDASAKATQALRDVRGKINQQQHRKLSAAHAAGTALMHAYHRLVQAFSGGGEKEGAKSTEKKDSTFKRIVAVAVSIFRVIQDAVATLGNPKKLTTGGQDQEAIKETGKKVKQVVVPEKDKKRDKPAKGKEKIEDKGKRKGKKASSKRRQEA